MIWSFRVQVAPGGVQLGQRRSQEVRRSPELQKGGLRALEEAWDDFLLDAFSCQVCLFSVVLGRLKLVPEGVELRPSLEVKGSPDLQNGGLRALEEVWDDFLLEAFACQVCSFSVLLGRLKLVPEGVELRPWRSLEVTRRAFTCCFSYNAQRVIRKRKNEELYEFGPKRVLG